MGIVFVLYPQEMQLSLKPLRGVFARFPRVLSVICLCFAKFRQGILRIVEGIQGQFFGTPEEF